MAKKVSVERVQETLVEFQNKKLTDKLINEIVTLLEIGKTIEKTRYEDGKLYVWCNFHGQYEPAEKFATKVNKKGKEVFKSNCKEGDKILRKFRALKRKLNEINLNLYRVGLMTPELEEELEGKLT